MTIPPERQNILKILPAELIEALRQPMPIAERRELIRAVVSDALLRQQALRYVEELRRARGDEAADATTPAD